jgi:hypothetical protein
MFAPTYFGKVPAPFFFETPDGGLGLHPPVFSTITCDVPLHDYMETERSLSDYLSFQFRVGLPLFVHDDWSMSMYRLKKYAGAIPMPAAEDKVTEVVYREIAEVCRENGSKMVIVVLNTDITPVPIPKSFAKLPGAVVDTPAALRSRLAEKTQESYVKEYHHWRGSPPVAVDPHPNSSAHAVMAEEIIRTIKDRQ